MVSGCRTEALLHGVSAPPVAVLGNHRRPIRPPALGIRMDEHANEPCRAGECGKPAERWS